MSLRAARDKAEELLELIDQLEKLDHETDRGGKRQAATRSALLKGAREKLSPIRIALTHARHQG